MKDYLIDGDEYDRLCEERRTENERYLDEFEAWLKASGLTDKTINKHITNVDFFINTYLLREDVYGIEEGPRLVDDFLGYFFIRKCMWSTPATIKENAASFKKFYKCMAEAGHVSKESYELLLANIKDGMPFWIKDCEEFNNPSSDSDFFGSSIDRNLFDAAYDIVARSLGLDELLGVGDGDLDDQGDALTREEVINALALALFYLTSWEEDGVAGDGAKVRRAWKSADADTLDRLCEKGFITCSDKDDSVRFTDDGLVAARDLVAWLGFEYLLEDES